MKSSYCKDKTHSSCSGSVTPMRVLCQCFCHHQQDCDCFSCRIRSVSFGQVPGGYKSSH